MTAPIRIRPAQRPSRNDAGNRSRRDGTTEPVFLDRTGRRRRLVTVLSAAAALLLTLIVLALLVGLTGMGGGSMPGWPAANGRPGRVQPTPQHTELAPSAAVRATATYRRSANTTPRTMDIGQPSSAVPTTTQPPTASASPTPTATMSATPTTKAHGRKPSHSPNPRSSRGP